MRSVLPLRNTPTLDNVHKPIEAYLPNKGYTKSCMHSNCELGGLTILLNLIKTISHETMCVGLTGNFTIGKQDFIGGSGNHRSQNMSPTKCPHQNAATR